MKFLNVDTIADVQRINDGAGVYFFYLLSARWEGDAKLEKLECLATR